MHYQLHCITNIKILLLHTLIHVYAVCVEYVIGFHKIDERHKFLLKFLI